MAPGASAPSKGRLTAATRHARKSSEYWERSGVLQCFKDYQAAQVRIARLLALQPKSNSAIEAVGALADAEEKMLSLHSKAPMKNPDAAEVFIMDSSRKAVAVKIFRRVMGQVLQATI